MDRYITQTDCSWIENKDDVSLKTFPKMQVKWCINQEVTGSIPSTYRIKSGLVIE